MAAHFCSLKRLTTTCTPFTLTGPETPWTCPLQGAVTVDALRQVRTSSIPDHPPAAPPNFPAPKRPWHVNADGEQDVASPETALLVGGPAD